MSEIKTNAAHKPLFVAPGFDDGRPKKTFTRPGNKCQMKAVRQLTLDGEFVAEYKSTRMAALNFHTNDTSIAKAARGESKTSGGYRWEYID